MSKCRFIAEVLSMLYLVSVVIFFLTIINIASATVVVVPSVDNFSSENPSGLDRAASHTIDGSGLTGDGSTHLQGENGIVWTTFGIYGATDYDPYITYDLGNLYDVKTMRIWNYNSAYQVGSLAVNISIIGADEVDIYTSTNGTDFTFAETVNFSEAPGTDDYTGQDIAVDYPGVRYIKFDIMTNHDGAVFDGTGSNGGAIDGRSLTGLSEVRFGVLELIEVNETDGTTVVHEGGDGDSYDIVLAEQPAPGATVEITATCSKPVIRLNEASSGSPVTLIFSDQNWDTPQTIAVTAVDDDILTIQNPFISHTSSSAGDPAFDNLGINGVSVIYLDNDSCGLWGYNRMDFNRDCRVDMSDFAIFASKWIEYSQPVDLSV